MLIYDLFLFYLKQKYNRHHHKYKWRLRIETNRVDAVEPLVPTISCVPVVDKSTIAPRTVRRKTGRLIKLAVGMCHWRASEQTTRPGLAVR